jgi:uncharacterized protein (DUF2236 family)
MVVSKSPAGDPYFPADSMLRRAQGERLVGLLYGFRAVYIGAVHPVAFTGTYLHTQGLRTPASRLGETAGLFEAVSLGNREQADRALRITAAKHKNVVGTLGEPIGPLPAETRYSAYDPELMLWTWAVLADSSIVMYETLVTALDPAEREALYQDWVRWGELFSMPPGIAPKTHHDFTRWFDEQLRSPDRCLTDLARLTAESVCFSVPLPLPVQPVRHVIKLLVLGTTPAPVRELYGVTWTVLHEAAFQAATTALRSGRRFPSILTTGEVHQLFDLVGRYERHRVSHGYETIPDVEHYERERAVRNMRDRTG